MPTAYSSSNYPPTQPRSIRQWAGLTAAAAFGALVAEGAKTATIVRLLDGAMRGLPLGTTLGDRYGLGALAFVAAAVFAGNVYGGAAGGFAAAAASRLDVRRKDLPTLRWYFLGIGRGLISGFSAQFVYDIVDLRPIWELELLLVTLVWTSVWLVGDVLLDRLRVREVLRAQRASVSR